MLHLNLSSSQETLLQLYESRSRYYNDCPLYVRRLILVLYCCSILLSASWCCLHCALVPVRIFHWLMEIYDISILTCSIPYIITVYMAGECKRVVSAIIQSIRWNIVTFTPRYTTCKSDYILKIPCFGIYFILIPVIIPV